MRIVAGDLKGRSFVAPVGQDTRPTTDRVREAVFSTLYSELGGWEGVRVLDLFAGSGAFGFEALSRGAERALGVDSGRAAQKAIRSNVEKLQLKDRYQVIGREVAQAFPQIVGAGPFDLIYLDPPYATVSEEVVAVLARLAEAGAISDGAIVGFEHRRKVSVPWPDSFDSLRNKEYGYTAVSYSIYRGGSGAQAVRSAAPSQDEPPIEEGDCQ